MRKKTLSPLFYEADAIVTPKFDKDIVRKENHKPIKSHEYRYQNS